MSNDYSYTYAILRYFHDIATGECVNVGVALLAPRAGFVGIKCTASADRTLRMFPDLNVEAFLAALRTIEARFKSLGTNVVMSPVFPEQMNISEIARSILPSDDSSLKWAPNGSGLTNDPEAELDRLFERIVQRYEVFLPSVAGQVGPTQGYVVGSNTTPPWSQVAGLTTQTQAAGVVIGKPGNIVSGSLGAQFAPSIAIAGTSPPICFSGPSYPSTTGIPVAYSEWAAYRVFNQGFVVSAPITVPSTEFAIGGETKASHQKSK